MPSAEKPAILLVNMDDSEDRLTACHQQLSSINMAFTRIPAVNGNQLTPQDLEQYQTEDDFLLVEDLGSLGEYLTDITHPWDCIKLMENPVKRRAVKSMPCKDKQLIVFNKVPSKTCAYVMSKAGAEKMLRKSTKIERPVDIDFQYWWENDMRVFGLQPYMVSVNHELESTIDGMVSRKGRRKSFYKKVVQGIGFYWGNRVNLKLRLKSLE
jgi:glycosyl transferase family 25